MQRTDILQRKDDILKWIDQNQSKAFICRELKCKPGTLNTYLNKMGIEYSGNKGMRGFSHDSQYKPAIEYIKNNQVNSHILKNKLIRENIKEAKCEICGLSEWQGREIPLELHHIDGNHYNNIFSNLQILCPNCHALQENNKGKANKKEHKKFCIDCGIPISKNALRCKSCAAKLQHLESPKNLITREELKNLIRTKSFTQIGKDYNVSDNAIRKWCDNYNLPRTKKQINSFTNEEWEKI